MKVSRYIVFSFGDNAWGRATLARELGDNLQNMGRLVSVVCGRTGAGSLQGSNIPIEVLPDLSGSLLQLYFEDMIDQVNPAGIVFCDGNSVLHLLRRRGVDSNFFRNIDAKVLGADTWNRAESGGEVDVFGMERRPLEYWPDWLCPILMAPLSRIVSVANLCCGLVKSRNLGDAVPSTNDPLLQHEGRCFALITTAPWQHADQGNELAAFVQRDVPSILASQIVTIPKLHLLHVGPEPIPGFSALGSRYHWLGMLSPARFEQVMKASAIYISLSPASVSQIRALDLQIPVLLVQHLEQRNSIRLPFLFRVWPLGYTEFLAPILNGNELMDALTVVELSRSESVIGGLRDLSFAGTPRNNALTRQNQYVSKVAALPMLASYVVDRCETK